MKFRRVSKALASALVKLADAEQRANPATLTLLEASSLLSHVRYVTALATESRMTKMSASGLLHSAVLALRHVHYCGACGEDSWESCASGGRHAARTLAAIEAELGLQPTAGSPET